MSCIGVLKKLSWGTLPLNNRSCVVLPSFSKCMQFVANTTGYVESIINASKVFTLERNTITFFTRQYPTAAVDRLFYFSCDCMRIHFKDSCRQWSHSVYHNFQPINNSIKSIVNRNFNELSSNSTTLNTFSQRPHIFSLERLQSLSFLKHCPPI